MIAGSPKCEPGSPLAIRWMAHCNSGYSSSWIPVSTIYLSPQFIKRALLGCLLSFVMADFVIGSTEANAAEADGKKECQCVKIAPITVNLRGQTLFLQITMTLKIANSAQVQIVKSNMPVILNELTLLLSDKDASQFSSSSGKQVLAQQAGNAINKALSLTTRNGVTDVFLESMVVQ